MSDIEKQQTAEEPSNIPAADSNDESVKLVTKTEDNENPETNLEASTVVETQEDTTKTKESASSDSIDKINESVTCDTKAGHATSKPCRELKSILELSKEAKLDTNIVHKRKSIEPTKLNDNSASRHRNSTISTTDNKDTGKRSTNLCFGCTY